MTQKRLGIWMDHADAIILDYTTNKVIESERIETEFTKHEKEKVLLKGESSMHNKEQQKVKEFYSKLIAIMATYDNILLFGPTNAKTELHNIIKRDRRFEKIRVTTQDCDYVTPNQISSFVSDYFAKP